MEYHSRLQGMSPTVLREGPYRLFFFSREEARAHVHVSHPDGEAKFWIDPSVELATQVGLSIRHLAEARRIVETHLEEIRHAWHRHFGS
jgi:hypothetical protein